MDKKLIKYAAILVGLIVLTVLFLLITNSITGGTKYSYEQIETKMVSAAKKYVENKKKNNIDILPDADGDSFTLSVATLVNEEYLKDLSEYTKDEVTCNGSVEIFNAGNKNYDYIPNLVCGKYYSTPIKLAEKVIQDNDSGVIQGSGLYQRVNGKFVTDYSDFTSGGSDSFEYVFRGDDVNNYVKIDDNLWRIVAIDESDNLLLIFNSHSLRAYSWDEKFNEDVKKSQGINTYESNGLESNIYKKVREFYGETIEIEDRVTYSPRVKTLITPMDICAGKRNTTDSDVSGKSECTVILENQLMGVLPAYYYMSASLDSNCDSIVSKSCGNYNYLSQFDDYWWLLTANSENTNEAFAISKKYAESSLCNYRADIRPIIKMGARAIYSEGDGSLNNPYQVKYYE